MEIDGKDAILSYSNESDHESDGCFYLFGHNGQKTYISHKQYRLMKRLNPSLLYADENGRAINDAKGHI